MLVTSGMYAELSMPGPSDAKRMCTEAVQAGATRGEIIGRLHESGASIIEAIKAVRSVFSVSLGEAKRLVMEHPAWDAEVAAAEPLLDDLVRSLETESDDGGRTDGE